MDDLAKIKALAFKIEKQLKGQGPQGEDVITAPTDESENANAQ